MARPAAPAALNFPQVLIEHLDPAAWRAKPPGGKGRTIAAIFAHVHNIRGKWLRLPAPHPGVPPRLDRVRCTQKLVGIALADSAARCSAMLAEALAGDGGRVRNFCRDGWANPWPMGAAMFTYMVCHDAHHRGQACMLAHQIEFPLPVQAASGIWNWEKLWRQCGFTCPG